MFYAACVFYGTAFMYNHAILCIFSPILEVEINIIIPAMLLTCDNFGGILLYFFWVFIQKNFF